MATKSLDETLEERGTVYGDFEGNLYLRQQMMAAINARYEAVNGKDLSNEQRHLFQDVIAKLARLAATPDHLDSWHDLAGYATLIEEVVQNEKR
ncbi:MAG: hypothetical protein DRQ78_11810 [Epsilonproteobacteria bacterium]|nr:MAG: hypothetical protein DRQ78_11810 [Campylobacterota bacterium]